VTIQTSLDWNKEKDRLKKHLSSINYNPNLHKVLNNIDTMVQDLSKLEVEARRTHNNSKLVESLEKINQSILQLEKLIVIAKLVD
jgi:hypothetical protein